MLNAQSKFVTILGDFLNLASMTPVSPSFSLFILISVSPQKSTHLKIVVHNL